MFFIRLTGFKQLTYSFVLDEMDESESIIRLFLLAIPIACIAWTVTHEEVFREPREYCVDKSQKSKHLLKRKFFYLFTCEYCFSHYVTALFLIMTDYQLLYNDWRGYLIGGFSLVWIANIYMSLYAMIRIDLKKNRIVAKIEEKKAEEME
ncbi:hypothetical protein [Desertivirga brevis]|uniref:hypothetical protein n=1 Tax=Desertivirga brevis TaxID=2810310 RepID=UPI001F612D16|nr:hypothetical protein [Pedobacter sp. SYSU D00873]